MIAAVLAVALCAVSSPDNSIDRAVSPEASFARFATYLLYGESQNSLQGDYYRWDSYKFNNELNVNDPSYWRTALSLLEKAVNNCENNPELANTSAMSNLQNYYRNFLFFLKYHTVQESNDEEIFDMYRSDGKDAALGYINEIYAGIYVEGSSAASAYIEAMESAYQAMIEYIEYYASIGCMTDSGLNIGCSSLPNLDHVKLAELQRLIDTQAEDSKLVIQDLQRALVSDCWNIYGQIRLVMEKDDE